MLNSERFAITAAIVKQGSPHAPARASTFPKDMPAPLLAQSCHCPTDARLAIVGNIYDIATNGIMISRPLGITLLSLHSVASVDIDVYPEYIHIPVARPAPIEPITV